MDLLNLEDTLKIILRTGIMFLMILTFLRISGRRGVRQLSIFELVIILGLGSAAGDPMFQLDLPLMGSLVVFIVVLLFYKIVTWLTVKFSFARKLFEGKPLLIIEDGLIVLSKKTDSNYAKEDFFSDLRTMSVDHLGQLKIVLLETDGKLSVLFCEHEQVKYGLPIFPHQRKFVQIFDPLKKYACMHCGYVQSLLNKSIACSRCQHEAWTLAAKNKRLI